MPKHESLQARSLGMNRAKEVSSSYEVHNVHVKWQIKKERDQKKKKRKETYIEKKNIYIYCLETRQGAGGKRVESFSLPETSARPAFDIITSCN